jgi:hypothetical protein
MASKVFSLEKNLYGCQPTLTEKVVTVWIIPYKKGKQLLCPQNAVTTGADFSVDFKTLG